MAHQERKKTMKKQEAGRKILGTLAMEFARYNDDVLFGEVWNKEEDLCLRDRSLLTIAALFSAGQYPQLKAHLQMGKEHGLTKKEVIAAFTQLAFYCGWPKAWSAFPLVEEVYGEEEGELDLSAFPVGEKNPYGKYFLGQSYLCCLSQEGLPVYNVTFEPRCRNFWHVHNASSGGGQTLIVVYGKGWYQEEGKTPRPLRAGDVVHIAPGVKHWHGAAKDSYFQHLSIEVPGTDTSTTWLHPVEDQIYDQLGE